MHSRHRYVCSCNGLGLPWWRFGIKTACWKLDEPVVRCVRGICSTALALDEHYSVIFAGCQAKAQLEHCAQWMHTIRWAHVVEVVRNWLWFCGKSSPCLWTSRSGRNFGPSLMTRSIMCLVKSYAGRWRLTTHVSIASLRCTCSLVFLFGKHARRQCPRRDATEQYVATTMPTRRYNVWVVQVLSTLPMPLILS
jgi:hypothetical protein